MKVWNKVLYNANTSEQLQEQLLKLQEEEYYKKLKERGINAEFKQAELDKLSNLIKQDPLTKTTYETRSKRISWRDHDQNAAVSSKRAVSTHQMSNAAQSKASQHQEKASRHSSVAPVSV